jgi:hypothetical protein
LASGGAAAVEPSPNHHPCSFQLTGCPQWVLRIQKSPALGLIVYYLWMLFKASLKIVFVVKVGRYFSKNGEKSTVINLPKAVVYFSY